MEGFNAMLEMDDVTFLSELETFYNSDEYNARKLSDFIKEWKDTTSRKTLPLTLTLSTFMFRLVNVDLSIYMMYLF